MGRRSAPKKVFIWRRVAVALIALALIAAPVAYFNRAQLRSSFDQLMGRDWPGPGTGEVTLRILNGDTGVKVAAELEQIGVVKNSDIILRLMNAENITLYPGTYSLKLQMSAQQAIDAIKDPKNLKVNTVTIKEGWRIGVVLEALSKATKIPVSQFEAVLKNPEQIGVPAAAPSAEGFLFPATYSFDPSMGPRMILAQMVGRTYQELHRFGVANADRLRVLTLASIIQKEARHTADFYKVSRVFTNRLKIGMPLQSDATVSYGSGGTTVTTTDAERADPNGYNTYVHTGLPIGPIGAPGSVAIDAALHPATGSWLYFCAVNLQTGDTVFSTTIAEHDAAVKKFQAWIQANPGWNGN